MLLRVWRLWVSYNKPRNLTKNQIFCCEAEDPWTSRKIREGQRGIEILLRFSLLNCMQRGSTVTCVRALGKHRWRS